MDLRKSKTYRLNRIAGPIGDALYSPCLFQFIGIPNDARYTGKDGKPGQYPGNNVHATQGTTDNFSIVTAPENSTAIASKTPAGTT